MIFTVKVGRLFVGRNRTPRPIRDNTGWRPVVWAKRLVDAEKFDCASSAHLWAKTWLAHDDFVVTPVPEVVSGGAA